MKTVDVPAGESSLFSNYRRAPVAFTHGKGVRLWDTEGRVYLDFLAGIATSSLGHAHPALVEAISQQAARVLHVSNLYRIPEQERAAQLLVDAAAESGATTPDRVFPDRVFPDRVFFCNSGAEANEAAIKLARKWGQGDGAGPDGPRFEIVVMTNGFHGRTLGALAATGTPAYHRGFEPLPAGFVHVPFNDLEAVRRAVGAKTCAVLVEPVQGEAGVFPAREDYLRGLEELCRERRLLLMLDEVQTGIGRTGSMFAFQRYGLAPDVVVLAKGLGGGVPVGAVLARSDVAAVLEPGDHGSTFGGNPLACAAIRAVLETIEREQLLGRVEQVAGHLLRGLEAIGDRTGRITALRSCGLMVAVDVTVEAPSLLAGALRQGLLIGGARPQTVRLLPPLIVSEEEVDEGLSLFETALSEAKPAS